jgi:ABC-type polar amino acid transport system ATPase subunit
MLKATGIYKNYGALPVLKGVDIEISKGEIVCIAGSSGAGKSTLLHILGTLDTADKGKIVIENKNIGEFSILVLCFNFIICFLNFLPWKIFVSPAGSLVKKIGTLKKERWNYWNY